MSKSLPWIHDQLDSAARDCLLRLRGTYHTDGSGYVYENERKLLNFAGNDYLNLAHDERLLTAVERELKRSGVGATASALIIGRGPVHRELEEKLAAFENQEAALLFPSGYAANVGTMTALVQPNDEVYCDRYNHASLVDGCRLSGAKLRIYRHDDLDTLHKEIAKADGVTEESTASRNRSSKRWIVTESIFSMDGDMAPLRELCDIADRHGAELIVDEAHATGVYGESGRGVSEFLGVEERIAVRVGTLSKALACQGGFAVGRQATIDWLWNNARTQMFSTGLSPLLCAGAIAAIDVVQTEPSRREHLRTIVNAFRDAIHSSDTESESRLSVRATGPIQPLMIGDASLTIDLAGRIKQAGHLVASIRPPTVPRNTSRLRISFSCAHKLDDVRNLASVISTEIEQRNSSASEAADE